MNKRHCKTLRLNPETRDNACRRLLSVKGHVEGVLRMLEDDSVYCVDVLKQLKAINGAVDQVGKLVLRSHLFDHVATAQERGDATEIVNELMEVLKYH